MLGTSSVILAQDGRDISVNQLLEIGNESQTSDGRRFRYGQAGSGAALAPGKMNDGATVVANHVNRTAGAAVTVGSTTVTSAIGNTAATLNQYAGGMVYANSTSTGLGIGYRIKGNPAADASGTLTVYLDEPVQVAIGATTKISVFPAMYSGAIVTPSAATAGGPPIGVFTGASLTASYFGWFQVAGPAPLLSDATVYTLGEEVSQAASGVAGSGSLKVATLPTYGDAMQLGVSGEYQLVNLRLN